MPCPNCGFENPADNKFCGECGGELAAVCASCGTANPPATKFCGECGSALRHVDRPARTATPVRAEQRLVSVLFADLVGFTPFSESRDSEEVRDLLTTYFDRSRAIVERFGGSVDKFIGDAVMAVWGATEAQEDDAERAVRAALELVDMVSGLGSEIGVPDLSLRAGVMTGATSVGPGGNEKGLVVGDLVNTASRLQSIADPGTVLVGEPTRNLTAASIQYEALGEQTVKGKEETVAAFKALRIIGELGGARIGEGLEAPFTGRDVELRLLKDQLHAAGSERSARMVSVIGDAGIGKSRLAWEMEKYLDGIAESVYWHRGRSPSYGDGLAMWALGEMVRRRAGITETEEPAKARLKLRTAVAEYVASGDDRTWLEPRLAALIGLEEAPTGDREELYAAIRTFFHHIADLGTTVLVFEDMHWADPGLLDFVTDLVERSPRHPILVVALSRPDLLEAHPGWGSGRSNFLSVHLGPLGDQSMADLVTGMAPGIPEDTVEAIVSRAGGIPLYAVEFVRMLVGSGDLQLNDGRYEVSGDAADLALPDSLQAVIGARLDRMQPADREIIQDAAVLGHSFTVEGLAVVRGVDEETLRSDLDRLVRQHVFEVDDDPRSPERGQYLFVQGAIREVAYGRLAKADRYGRHLRVAEYFEGLSEASGLVGAVASHYLAAAEAAPDGEGGELLERGRTALADAAARAAALQSHAAALSLYGQALELTPGGSGRAALLEAASEAAVWASDVERSLALAAEAAQLFVELGDEEGRLRAITLQGFTLNSNFRADEGVALLRPVYDAMDEPESAVEVAFALETARAHMLDQDPAAAVEVSARVLGRAEEVLPPASVIDGLITKATAIAWLGRIQEATALLVGSVSLADEHQLQHQAIRAFNNLVVVRSFDAPRVDPRDLADFIDRVRRFGATAWVNRALLDAAIIALFEGRVDTAEGFLDEVEPLVVSELELGQLAYNRALLAAATGQEGGLGAARTAATVFDGASDAQLRVVAANQHAEVAFLESDFETMFEHTLLDPTPTGMLRSLVAAALLGDEDRIRRALQMVDGVGAEGRLAKACHALGEAAIAADEGRTDAADQFAAMLVSLERIVEPLQFAIGQALFCRTFPDHPVAREAGGEGLDWMREHGLGGFAAVVEPWVPAATASAETA